MAPLLALMLAAAPAPRLTFAFIPPGGPDDDAKALGLVLQTRTSEVLRATGLFNELHAKQMLSMAGSEAFKPDFFGKTAAADANVAWYLGADAFLSGTLAKDKEWTFSGSAGLRGDKPTAVKPVKLGDKPVAALNLAIGDISKQMAALGKKKVAKWPDLTVGTASDAALLSYAKCLATVVRQPMGIENPVTLNGDAITGAIKDCRAALEADPKFAAAKVALALALAIDGTDAEAAKLLSETGEQDSALYWIARFWLVTRYQSAEAGEGLLKQALEKRPGFLLAQIYLCEDLTALGQKDKAVGACEDAALATPKGVFPLLRVGKALAREGKVDEGIKKSQDALALEPADLKSREASLQLASRYIDANKVNDALGILEQIAHDENVRGEELLRLGYAYQLKGDGAKAKGLYENAIAKATSPGEWRTRGRAYYDIALLEVKAGAKEKAKEALRQSVGTGFKAKPLDPALTDIARDVERAALSADPKGQPAKGKPTLVPKEVNLFQVDASGELEVGPAGKEPPKDFVGIKF
jgi:tetratricopeptide (TPR) repeat protein